MALDGVAAKRTKSESQPRRASSLESLLIVIGSGAYAEGWRNFTRTTADGAHSPADPRTNGVDHLSAVWPIAGALGRLQDMAIGQLVPARVPGVVSSFLAAVGCICCVISSDDIVSMSNDFGLDTLLDLDGTLAEQGGGYWIAIAAWRVPVTAKAPAGVRYSLTLHGPDGRRLLGYDNAHATTPSGKFTFSGKRLPYDHKHRHQGDRGVPYAFSSAYQLLTDFFSEADIVLKQETI